MGIYLALTVAFSPHLLGSLLSHSQENRGRGCRDPKAVFYASDGQLSSGLFHTLMATVLPGDHGMKATVRSGQLRRRWSDRRE